MAVLWALIGGVPDYESGFHTQSCVLTQKRSVLRRSMYKAKNIYISSCKKGAHYQVTEVTVINEGTLL